MKEFIAFITLLAKSYRTEVENLRLHAQGISWSEAPSVLQRAYIMEDHAKVLERVISGEVK